MTPFQEKPERTATISLSKQEEEFVRNYDGAFDTPFNRALCDKVFHKLYRSLKTTDTLLGPVGHTRKDPSPGVIINLDLIGT